MSEDSTVYFKEAVSESQNGRPVGICPDGVLAWNFPGFRTGLAIIPFSQIDQIIVTRESRGWRIITTTGAFIGCAFGGYSATALLGGWLDGKVRLGLGGIFVALSGPILLISCFVTPFWYFTRLGYYFHIQVGKKRGKYYFSPSDWDAKKANIRTLLDAAGRGVEFP